MMTIGFTRSTYKLLATAVLLCTASASQAGTVFQSIPDLAVSPVINAWCSTCSGSYKVLDSFQLTGPATLNTLTFAVQSDYYFPTDVTVDFYTGSTAALGAEIASFTFTPGSFVSTFDTPFNTSLVTVNFAPLALAGGDYSLSISNPGNLGVPGYAGGSGQLFQSGVGYHDGQSAGFSIGNAVPEPASWALMIGGFGLMGVTMRVRRTTRAQTASSGTSCVWLSWPEWT